MFKFLLHCIVQLKNFGLSVAEYITDLRCVCWREVCFSQVNALCSWLHLFSSVVNSYCFSVNLNESGLQQHPGNPVQLF